MNDSGKNGPAAGVVDDRFPGSLPGIHHLLRMGPDEGIVVEVITQLDYSTVRGIALTPTQGLARGMPVVDAGHPLRVPVGKQLRGRMFNVFGDTIDRGEKLEEGPRRAIYRAPVPLTRQFEELEAFARFGTRLDESTRRTLERGRRVREIL